VTPDREIRVDYTHTHTHSERNIWNGPIVATAIANVTQDMLERVWREWEYHLDICRVKRVAHIECM